MKYISINLGWKIDQTSNIAYCYIDEEVFFLILLISYFKCFDNLCSNIVLILIKNNKRNIKYN